MSVLILAVSITAAFLNIKPGKPLRAIYLSFTVRGEW
jgi:hypothetical protein